MACARRKTRMVQLEKSRVAPCLLTDVVTPLKVANNPGVYFKLFSLSRIELGAGLASAERMLEGQGTDGNRMVSFLCVSVHGES